MGATTILTTDTPQTVIDANANVGEVFTFEAGTHNVSSPLTPSANDQIFQGETDGTPVSVTPDDPDGVSLGKTKTLWSSGTPTSILDGGSSTRNLMVDHSTPITWTGITIRKLKVQNFVDDVSPYGLVGGEFTQDWVIEDCWCDGGYSAVKAGQSMIFRRNRCSNQFIWWLNGWQAKGTAANPCIAEDNDVYDVNLTENGGVSNDIGDPQWDAGFKLLRSDYWIIRRNYIRNVHGPGIWFDARNDNTEIYDNITVDCGINTGGGTTPHVFYEINYAHGGAIIRNNWVLGRSAWILVSHSHGDGSDYIEVYENTVDCDSSDRQGINITDGTTRGGGDSTTSPAHPAINTVSLGSGKYFTDRIRFYDNVVRKRNSSFNTGVPMAGMQTSAGDPARNYEWNGNKYEVNSAIASPFKWNGSLLTFANWKLKRAATGDAQNTGPYFDVGGSLVAWSGTKQYADTVNNWENASAGGSTSGVGMIPL